MSGQPIVTQILLTVAVGFVFVVSLLGLALGLGLMLKGSATLSFITLMNRWVSTRQALEPLEAPVHIRAGAAGKRWFAVILVAIGAYAAVALIGSFDVPRLALAFKIDPRLSAGSLALETLKWTLVLGAIAAVVAGLMLLFFPLVWQRLEERANRWYSTRTLESAGDAMYLPLERIVAAYPRASGAAILALSLAAAVASGLLLFAAR